MTKRDIFRFSEPERPRALFRKRKQFPLLIPLLLLVLVMLAAGTTLLVILDGHDAWSAIQEIVT